uniref:Multiple epidermal growth factor-like domains protein 10 isoform X1 n=1 Tax=Crassostrea virginica TaxID=6565 RepID=A0A8B8F0M1_CRAVI|nr:multiple epidermal growth factor-like domains protein 10 isoform X1 [Crassostrea virginica]
MDHFFSLTLLLSTTSLYSKNLDNLIEPECFDTQNLQNKRCCTDFRTVGGKCQECVGFFGLECSKPCPEGYHGKKCREKCQCKLCDSYSGECVNATTEALNNVEDKHDKEKFWTIIVGILCGVIILLIVVLLTVISYKRKLPISRPYQQEHITTDTVSMDYASVENNTYLECNLTENTEILIDGPNQNQLEENKTKETGSGHYFSVNQDPNPNADIWKSIKETVKKNRERKSMLQLLTQKNLPQNTNERLSYISVVEDQLSSANKPVD